MEPANQQAAKICYLCGLPILDSFGVFALNQTYHREHFVCTACSRPLLLGKNYLHKNQPYCPKDYQRLFTHKCARCSGAIMGRAVELERYKKKIWFHVHCFRCRKCQEPITQKRYIVDDFGNIYCGVCQIGRDHCEYCDLPLPYIRHRIDRHGLPVCDDCYKKSSKTPGSKQSGFDDDDDEENNGNTTWVSRKKIPFDQMQNLDQTDDSKKTGGIKKTGSQKSNKSQKAVKKDSKKSQDSNKKASTVLEMMDDNTTKSVFGLTQPDKRILKEEELRERLKQVKTQQHARERLKGREDDDLKERYRNFLAVEQVASGVDDLYRVDQNFPFEIKNEKSKKMVAKAYLVEYNTTPFDDEKNKLNFSPQDLDSSDFMTGRYRKRHEEKSTENFNRKNEKNDELADSLSKITAAIDNVDQAESISQYIRVVNYEDFTPEEFEIKNLD